jgi:hypothetical protein
MTVNDVNDWKEEWVGMPEYVQEKKVSYFKEITVRFQTEEDMDTFYELIEQKPPNKLKSIWFPKKEKKIAKFKEIYADKKYPVTTLEGRKFPIT